MRAIGFSAVVSSAHLPEIHSADADRQDHNKPLEGSDVSQEPEGDGSLLGLLAGIGVGLLVGAAIALIAAPQSGETTREQLREGAEEVLGSIKESVDDLRVKLDEVRAAIRRRGQGGPEEDDGQQGGPFPAAG